MIEVNDGFDTFILVSMVKADGTPDVGEITTAKLYGNNDMLSDIPGWVAPSTLAYEDGLCRVGIWASWFTANGPGDYFLALKTSSVGATWTMVQIRYAPDNTYQQTVDLTNLCADTSDAVSTVVSAMRGSRVLRNDVTNGWVLDVYIPGAVVGTDPPMFTKRLRDKDGAAITNPATGAVAQELEIGL